jgi:hypothetical protein
MLQKRRKRKYLPESFEAADFGASSALGLISALGLTAIISSPAAKPNDPVLFEAGATDFISGLVSAFTSGTASTLGVSFTGSATTGAVDFSSGLLSTPGIGKLVTMLTAMSLDDDFGL